jgi:predicted peroxiredoxin
VKAFVPGEQTAQACATGLATAKMAVTMSPDTEIVSSDDNAGTIVVRDKKTGKVVTMKFDPQKKAMVITDENGKTTSLTTTGEGENAGMEMKSAEGTVKIGSGSDKAPDWVPVYPGSSPQGTFSTSSGTEQTGSYTFVTKDPADKVIAFYGDSLKAAGFAVSNMTTNSDGKTGGMVSGEDKANKRAVVVGLGTENDGTHVNVTFTIKQ